MPLKGLCHALLLIFLFRKEYISTAVGVPQNTAPKPGSGTPTHSMAGEIRGRSTNCTTSWNGYCGCGLGKLLHSSKFIDPEFFSTGNILSFPQSPSLPHKMKWPVLSKKCSLKIQRNLKSEFLFPLQKPEEWEWERREKSKGAWWSSTSSRAYSGKVRT